MNVHNASGYGITLRGMSMQSASGRGVTLGGIKRHNTDGHGVKIRDDFMTFLPPRHLDKGSDLLEEAGQCSNDPRSCGSSSGSSGLKELARSLKQHIRGFSERLEDTRERLEDTSRCFYLLDKADDAQTPEQILQVQKHVQQYLMAHPPIAEDHFTEMLQLARKLNNEKLLEQAKASTALSVSRKLTSTPLGISSVGRRRSVGSFPYIYICNHHAAGHACSCWDPIPSSVLEESQDCCCSGTGSRPNNLGNIQEVRESAEDLLDNGADDLGKDSSGACSKPVPPVPVNSHLHCRASNLDLTVAAPGSKELKTQKTLLLIMREMIQTERDYVKSLEYIIENYIPELLREDIPQALRGQRNVIFGNVEKIYEFHSQYFLQELERCENSPLLVGQCFLRHEKKFYLYALYNKNKPKSDSLMSEYGTSFFKTKQVELGDKMDLASYLLKPVQRMGKYALLLQQLMKAYPDKEVDVTDIRSAEQMVRFQLRHGNDLLAMDSLRDCDVNVKEQGRLLRQNEFLVWQGKGKKCLRQVFLFEELILFSKARRFPDRKNLDLYIYKNSIKMTDIGLTAKIGESTTKFEIWFRKRKPNDTFTLQSMSEEIKQLWTEEISKLLWKQALRNREMRLAEMSSMGIGNKPCLDIRPSADQISDRSISIAQLSKTAPRFRNSITVSSGELSRSNKRPHSIISVSSSSSSGGSSSSTTSQSSASGYGPLINLGFDPADSPHMHHRSTTLNSQCSMESGIIADISLGSEDTDASGNHWHVERSNSSVTSTSLDSSMSPTSPVSPTEEDKGCLTPSQTNDSSLQDFQRDQDELTIKL
ncbi:hypothetical protein Cfor_02123 [Coptotermes formosanus]|uniref:DH domain-containing protein n=1 Tax=Coptotermes formosanus TaxID=36987 RepID=A0A6L2PA86_COPFO|nr:hypothetical protein Cfor_02123 [Coptotermes formosanus]